MISITTKLYRHLLPMRHLFPTISTLSASQTLEESIKLAIESKAYQRIPELLVSLKQTSNKSNPFMFLSTFTRTQRTRVIDELLQSLLPQRPRSLTHTTYSCLLSYTLQSPDPLPLAFAVLQCTLWSGALPVPQTQLLLSSAWSKHRCESRSVASVLLEWRSIGYIPDCGVCNYLLSSLCAVDHFQEAVIVLKGMPGAGCVPDVESYGIVIKTMSKARKTQKAIELMKEMVVKMGLTPRQGMVVKLLAALRANREMWKAIEMIELLEKEGYCVGFESYELVVEGCLECKEYILAAKVVMGMTEKGFIPYIKVRQKVVEGLANIGEWKLASAVRKRFEELNS